jgi:hypothetical protein
MQAAEIIGCTARTVRRCRFEHDGYEGLLDPWPSAARS